MEPEALRNRPELYPDLEPLMQAFEALSRGRPLVSSGFGAELGAISFSEIKAYLDLFPADDPEAFVRLLRVADEAYLRRAAEKRRAAGSHANTKTKSKR